MRRRPIPSFRVSLTEDLDPEEDLRIQTEAINRMKVFDAAPKAVREQAKQWGEPVLIRWWATLETWEAEDILADR